jgi:hypothetical protein
VLFRFGDARLGEKTAPEALAREQANILLVAKELEGQDKQSKQ